MSRESIGTRCTISPKAALGAPETRWVSESEIGPADGKKVFNLAYYFQHAGIVYTFSLLTDEAHYDAYRADFDELCASARFSQPTKGVAPLPAGYWLTVLLPNCVVRR